MQGGPPLDSSRAGVVVIDGIDTATLAARAADWVEGELRRPIERR
jgi:hypothetical protein